MKLNRNKVCGNNPSHGSKSGCGTGVKHSASASDAGYEVEEEDIEIYKNK